MSENIHAGHRNRLKEEIISSDITELKPPVKLLEMLLFYGIPRQDTARIAHDMMSEFGGICGVFEADIDDLAEIKGMTKNAASLVKLIPYLLKAYLQCKYEDKEVLKTHEEIGDFIHTKYFGVNHECLSLLCLDRLGKVLSFKMLMHGSIDSVGINLRSILERVFKCGATAVVVAHNHPGGVALPSAQDVEQTRKLAQQLKTLSVNLVDHIIVTDTDYVSMAQSAEFHDIFEV